MEIGLGFGRANPSLPQTPNPQHPLPVQSFDNNILVLIDLMIIPDQF
jgi:hypothetical protein